MRWVLRQTAAAALLPPVPDPAAASGLEAPADTLHSAGPPSWHRCGCKGHAAEIPRAAPAGCRTAADHHEDRACGPSPSAAAGAGHPPAADHRACHRYAAAAVRRAASAAAHPQCEAGVVVERPAPCPASSACLCRRWGASCRAEGECPASGVAPSLGAVQAWLPSHPLASSWVGGRLACVRGPGQVVQQACQQAAAPCLAPSQPWGDRAAGVVVELQALRPETGPSAVADAVEVVGRAPQGYDAAVAAAAAAAAAGAWELRVGLPGGSARPSQWFQSSSSSWDPHRRRVMHHLCFERWVMEHCGG